jgi:phosphohistidine phosphatase
MKLHLLRHAKTNPTSPSGLDFDRELMPRGYEQLQEFKAFHANHPFQVGQILCSSAVRTRQTLEEIKGLFSGVPVTFIDELYLSSSGEMLQIINQLQCAEDLLVIGHNEGISVLGFELTNDILLLKTAGYAGIEFAFEHSGYISKRTGTTLETFRVRG